jgi:hypothetical protein
MYIQLIPRACPIFLLRLVIVQTLTERIASLLGITKQHLCVRVVEERIRYLGIPYSGELHSSQNQIELTSTHASFHDDHVLAPPDVEYWHTCDGGSRFQSDWIDGVIRSDHQDHIGIGKVVVDFVHLQDHCLSVRHVDMQEGIPSYGTPASAKSTLHCPGIRPATG